MYVHMMIVEVDQEPYIVEISSDHCPVPGDMVEFNFNDKFMVGIVMHTAYMKVGDEDYTMIQMLFEIHKATKFWSLSWGKEATEDES